MHNAPIELLAGTARRSVILLHGLGTNGEDMAPVARALNLRDVRFILPHAPERPVTINNGFVMPAWYDIRTADIRLVQDEAGFSQSRAAIETLIRQELARGIPGERIVLAGFSQGGAVAFYSGLTLGIPLAGIAGLSTYLPQLSPIGDIPPIWLGHGTTDTTIPLTSQQASFSEFPGGRISSHVYPIGHEISQDEISDLRRWLTAHPAGD